MWQKTGKGKTINELIAECRSSSQIRANVILLYLAVQHCVGLMEEPLPTSMIGEGDDGETWVYLKHRLVVVLRDHLLEVRPGTGSPFHPFLERLKRIPWVVLPPRLNYLAFFRLC